MLGSDISVKHVIKLPSREWAECGAGDLRGAGYRATVQPDPDGNWKLVVHGSEEQIRTLKDGIAEGYLATIPQPHLLRDVLSESHRQ
jgi:hypothetical protein